MFHPNAKFFVFCSSCSALGLYKSTSIPQTVGSVGLTFSPRFPTKAVGAIAPFPYHVITLVTSVYIMIYVPERSPYRNDSCWCLLGDIRLVEDCGLVVRMQYKCLWFPFNGCTELRFDIIFLVFYVQVV